jgi:hypothetical protein
LYTKLYNESGKYLIASIEQNTGYRVRHTDTDTDLLLEIIFFKEIRDKRNRYRTDQSFSSE